MIIGADILHCRHTIVTSEGMKRPRVGLVEVDDLERSFVR
jgi:hypothetical protein